jgi:hypothetical protein
VANKQRRTTVGDMVRSIAIILVPILLISWLLTNDLGDYPVQKVEWQPVLEQARAEAEWPVAAPVGLPEEGRQAWVPTRATWVKTGGRVAGGDPSPRNHWRVGLLSPEMVYHEVNQADGEPALFIADVTRKGRRVGEEAIAGRTWERWESEDGRTRSLLLRSDPTVTMVTADAEFSALQQFARTMQWG